MNVRARELGEAEPRSPKLTRARKYTILDQYLLAPTYLNKCHITDGNLKE